MDTVDTRPSVRSWIKVGHYLSASWMRRSRAEAAEVRSRLGEEKMFWSEAWICSDWNTCFATGEKMYCGMLSVRVLCWCVHGWNMALCCCWTQCSLGHVDIFWYITFMEVCSTLWKQIEPVWLSRVVVQAAENQLCVFFYETFHPSVITFFAGKHCAPTEVLKSNLSSWAQFTLQTSIKSKVFFNL